MRGSCGSLPYDPLFFCRYCGWHTYGISGADALKFSFVGQAVAKCPYSCMAQVNGPHGATGVDAVISIIAHELAEAVSDPLLNAWYRSAGGDENADVSVRCASVGVCLLSWSLPICLA